MAIKDYELWVNNANLETYLRTELEMMNEAEKFDAFYQNLEFGTGGMRGLVGAGTNRMNIYTIRKANFGFARYLLNRFHDVIHRGIVIAYDNRHFSREFALESAKVMASNGIKAYLFEGIRPTPELSFAVRYLNAIGGIVITASHNPPTYNGYKIYDENGCQLVPNLANQVIEYVNGIEDVFNLVVKDEDTLRSMGLIETIGETVDQAYINMVKGIQLNPNLDKSKLRLVFTPLHGTANVIARNVLRDTGYHNVFVVESQTSPDPDFSTVKSPNPEDPESYTLGIELANTVNADLVIATDPDADRVGIAVKHQDEYVLLNGNQTGAILLYYILTQRRIQNRLPKDGVVFNTIVTSNFGKVIAESFGLKVTSTLTGFKFIGEQIQELQHHDQAFLFGYEESYGYLIADFVRDKDAIQSLLMIAEAACYFKHFGKTLYDVLLDLYANFGYYQEKLISLTLTGSEGQAKIKRILDSLRQKPISHVTGMKVIAIEDYLTRTRYESETVKVLTLPKSNVLKYILEDGSWFVLRPSGTEPKMKLYIGTVSDNLEKSQNKIQRIETMVMDFIHQVN